MHHHPSYPWSWDAVSPLAQFCLGVVNPNSNRIRCKVSLNLWYVSMKFSPASRLNFRTKDKRVPRWISHSPGEQPVKGEQQAIDPSAWLQRMDISFAQRPREIRQRSSH